MSTYAADAARSDSRADPVDERPLSDEERQLVARVLSDPFSFPQQYKTWLVAFLEGSDLTLPLSSVLGLSSLLGSSGGGSPGIFKLLPAGMIFAWSGTAVPNGCFECNGQALSRVTYDRLFKVTGTRWGAGDGATTFNVPDFRRRGLWGAGSGYPVGQTDGLAEGSRTGPVHHHDFSGSGSGYTVGSDGGHRHDLNASGHGANDSPNTFQGLHYLGSPGGAVTDWTGEHNHGVQVNVGGSTTGGGAKDVISHAYAIYMINA